MAQVTRRATAPVKPAPKPASRPAATAAPSKAVQAAIHQGRLAPAAAPRAAAPRASVPATRPTQAVADPASTAHLPAFMRGDANAGKENIDREDMETPRLKLMQGLSKELEAYDGLRPGCFFHTAAEHVFDAPFRAVVLVMDRRYILWRPLENGGGILARADDGTHWNPAKGEFKVKLDKKDGGQEVTWRLAPTVRESGLDQWGTMNPADPNSPPAATLMYTYVLAFPDLPDLMPAALTFQRTGIKMGRRLNTKLRTVRTPLYGSVFQFEAVSETNANGQKYFNIQATGAGLVEDENLYNGYKQFHESMRDAGLQIQNIEGLQGESDTPDDEGSDETTNY